MINFFFKLFKLNHIPEKHRQLIEQQGIILKAEGASGHIFFKNFRAPGKIFMRKKVWFKGSLFLTQKALYGFAFAKTIINVPIDHPGFAALNISMPKHNVISFQFDPSLFDSESSGDITCNYKTDKAKMFFDQLKQL